MSKQRILVTGSAGYIGSVMVPYLESQGHDVTALDLGLYRSGAFTPDASEGDGRDIRDATPDWFEDIDAVVHLAALSNDPLGDLDPRLTYDINHHSTVRFAELAKEAGVQRFIFSSSCSLYGAHGDKLVDETADFAPVTPYAESKVHTEHALRKMADDEFAPTYLRNATVYGSSPRLRLDIVVNNLTAWAVATGAVRIQSDGTPWRPQVHVEDVCRAVGATLTAPTEAIWNEAFNVGRNEENYQVRDIAEIVSDVVGAELAFSENAGPDPRSYRVDFSKIVDVLPEFAPRWTVRLGVEQLAKDYRDFGMVETSFPMFTRLATIKREQAAGTLDSELRWTA